MIALNTKQPLAGVDIGTRSIKLARIKKNRLDEFQLAEAVMVTRPDAWEFDDVQYENPRSSLTELVAALQMSTAESEPTLACVPSMALCDSRFVDVEPGIFPDPEYLADKLSSIERLANEPRVFDYWDVDSEWSPRSNGGYLMSMRQSWAAKLADDFSMANTTTSILDGIPMALARAVWLCNPQEEKPVAVLDWGYTRATFVVCQNSRPVYVRMFRQGGLKGILTILKEHLKLTEMQALSLLRKEGLGEFSRNETQNLIYRLLQEPLHQFQNEFMRTGQYLKSLRAANGIEKLYLTGGGSTVHGLATWMQSYADLQVSHWNLDSSDEESIKYPSLFAAAAGMSAVGWSD